ncbi:23S rRNA (adenine-C8)-methyltransferase [Planifilum fimeticola]|uniref:23S rRNA (Adenine-C8)-methyltransferase n=1 Tax=Planifilum fimeticola TaxID=201975 RepID=A0A2T0LBF9_9BACL|nr:23S rRNA (adenine(2503)-C(8))-methyltransferase Cfr [Planifilum fimeticola]PRX39188.1 23S rRNA (adenine-C8)-methyltransferase [Planifilum fimeticola]
METKYDRLKAFVAEKGWPMYRFNQILHAIFKERIGEFERMATLPLPLRHQLRERFGKSVLRLRPALRKRSGQADKVLFELPDSNKIETVRLIYRAGWQSYCVSSQCGCGFGCSFCATGKIGFKRNLSADEITDQILYFHLQNHPIDSISLMGMGEALANPQTFAALKVLTDPRLFNLSPRRITVSTIGLIPQIERLSREFPQVNLTFSLHSPFDEQRSALMPINRKYPLNEVLDALDAHIRKNRRKVYIAYIVLPGVNDTPEHAGKLISLLRGRGPWDYLYHVNLIRYNPASGAPKAYQRPNEDELTRFCRRLRRAGVKVTVRQSFGVDIEAACGQLYGRYYIRGKPEERKSPAPQEQ